MCGSTLSQTGSSSSRVSAIRRRWCLAHCRISPEPTRLVELVALREKLLQQYKDELPDSVETQAEQLIPGRLAVFLL